jgi:hypothetical protein
MPLSGSALWRIVRRGFLYVGIALADLAIFAVVIVFTKGARISAVWGGLAFWTPVTFWIAVKPCRKYWRSLTFWLTVMGVLVVHLFAFTAVLRGYPHWRPIWFVFTAAAEGVLLSRTLGALFSREVG